MADEADNPPPYVGPQRPITFDSGNLLITLTRIILNLYESMKTLNQTLRAHNQNIDTQLADINRKIDDLRINSAAIARNRANGHLFPATTRPISESPFDIEA